MNPVRDDEKHNPLMARGKKSFFRFGKLTKVGSAEQIECAVDYYFSNQIASPVAEIASGASCLPANPELII